MTEDCEGLEKIKARLCALEELVGAHVLDDQERRYLQAHVDGLERQRESTRPWGGLSRAARIRLKVFRRVLAFKPRVVRLRE